MATKFTFRTLCDSTSAEMAVACRTIFEDFNLPPPRQFDGAAFERRYSFEHLDRAASLIITDGGAPAATILVARRGRLSHISGLGVAPQYRRQGLARTMLSRVCDAAAARGDSQILVEVPAANTPARALYQIFGFSTRRDLVGYSGPLLAADVPLQIEEMDAWPVVTELTRHGPPDLPWFFHPSSLAGCATPTRAYHLEHEAFAVVTPRGMDLNIRTVFVRPELRRRGLATQLLRSIARKYSTTSATVMPFVPINLCDGFFLAIGMARSEPMHVEMARVP